MYKFLDLPFAKRFNVLKLLMNSSNHSLSQVELLDQLDVTVITLNNLFSLINQDFDKYGYSEKIQLGFDKTTKTYFIKKTDDFSLQFIMQHYLEESVRFKITKRLLMNDLSDINTSAKELFMSYNSLRRELKYLKDIFNDFGLQLVARKKIYLQGNELHIRLFFTFLYLDIYGAYHWPFKFISYFEVSEFVELFPEEIYNYETRDKSILLHYFTAISLLRVKMGFLVKESTITEALFDPSTVRNRKNHESIRELFSKFTPKISAAKREKELSILYSCILAFGTYDGLNSAPSFFFTNPALKEKNLVHDVFHLINSFTMSLETTLTDFEYNKLLNGLMVTHYRIELFTTTLSSNFSQWTLNSIVVTGYNEFQIETYTNFIEKELETEKLQHLRPYKAYLVNQYLNILTKTLDSKKVFPTIRVAYFSKMGNYNFYNYLNNVLDGQYSIEITNQIDSSVDLVISDIILSNEVIQSLNTNQHIVYIDYTLSDYDYILLIKTISTVIKNKFKRRLHAKPTE